MRRSDVPRALAAAGGARPVGAVGPERTSASAGAVLRAVLDHGPVARSTVARLTGLSPASVTGLTGHLLDAGLLRPAPEAAAPQGVGRPTLPLDVDSHGPLALGAHVAAAHTTLALLDLRGRVVASRRDPHPSASPDDVLAALADRVPTFVREHAAGRDLLGLGLASGGWVDAAAGTVVHHPVLGWHDVEVRHRLERRTGLPVHVDGHARALLRAEQLVGRHRARARASTVLLFVGNVVDAAFATGGPVHAGPRSAAGGIAHLPVGGVGEPCGCGRDGCLQSVASERAVLRRAREAGVPLPPGAGVRALADAALAGDDRAVEVLRERARTVGRAVAMLLDLLDPALLTVVEPGVGRVPGCLDELRAAVAAESRAGVDLEVVQASSFPAEALAVAGGAIVLDAVYSSPLTPLGVGSALPGQVRDERL